MSIKETAHVRGVKPRTILSHIKECIDADTISRSEIVHCATGNEVAIATIHRVCAELGTEKLKPIFEHFDGSYSYDTIQLAVLLFEQ